MSALAWFIFIILIAVAGIGLALQAERTEDRAAETERSGS